jgi:hypothetical protein
MKIKLKEDPPEWRKFTWQFCGLIAVLGGVVGWRKGIAIEGLSLFFGTLSLTSLLAWLRPGWFRGFYRFGMISSAWMGARVGRVVLTIFFFLILVPLGLVLRLFGHDPLRLKKRPGETSYWTPVGKSGGFEKMY